MTPVTAPSPFAVLDELHTDNLAEGKEQSAPATVTETLTDRVIGAFEVAQAYLEQILDPETRFKTQEKLKRSNVRGSLVVGINGADDVVKMLAACNRWTEIVANLKDDQIVVLQGQLPDTYAAFAAYASVREIYDSYQKEGLAKIETKLGYQNEGEFYHCTVLRMPTRIITVQVRKDASGIETLHQWFAGPELTSRMQLTAGDAWVRCNVLPPLVAQRKPFKGYAPQGRRPHRDQ